jgi:SAM-dependent methyltransferase
MSRCLFLFAWIVPFLAFTQAPADKTDLRVVYVPTPQGVVEKMLELAKTTRADVVFDLGCGDGRVVCTAAKKHGARGIGIDIDPDRIADSAATMRRFGVTANQVEFRQGDALKVKDLERASVVCLYMLPEFMERLEPQVLARLRPGTRLVAHDFPFPNMKPEQMIDIEGPERTHTLYLWTVPEPKADSK